MPWAAAFICRWPNAKLCAEARNDWLAELVGYSKFFLILTGVFGTISGVGIWFAIGLTQS